MISRVLYSLKYIKYKLFAKHKKGHGIHSPFMFKIITEVFNNKKIDSDLKDLLSFLLLYKRSKQKIHFQEIGAGSKIKFRKTQSLGSIIKRSSISNKYGILLFNLIKYFEPKNILELGSSVGISSAFISQAAKSGKIVSMEGVREKIEIAKKIASELKLPTNFILGNFNTELQTAVNKLDKLDFVFFDGNHTKESTINYFNICLSKVHNETIFVFDDIHWSEEMEQAWSTIINNKQVLLSIDLYRMGLIFFRKELSKEHYVIKF